MSVRCVGVDTAAVSVMLTANAGSKVVGLQAGAYLARRKSSSPNQPAINNE